ncbi:MAG: TonB-dependent receptor, partial [Rheinheimera sp.]|nr:TonB-dependent receptor [Rheinheimera sp.]
MRRSGVLNRYSLLATLIGLSFSAAAQQATQHYRGVITDQNGKPLTDARVHVHGRQHYVYSDQQGQFSIAAPADAELHISAKGYGDQFVTLSDKTSLNIALVQGGIERIVVAASGIHQTDLEMATPVTVLSGEDLQRRSEPTLGETLKFEPGVHANYFGPVASSPVIRGLDGPRVRILNNGLDTADVSRVGPDHAISADAISAEQIEVLRGPATLLYGSGAIGGVINVVDNRIPRQLRAQSETKLEGRYADVSDEKTIALNHEGSTDSVAWHLDGFNRDTADYQLPRFRNDEGEIISKLENSWLQTHNLNAGVSLIGSAGLIGVSVGRLESDYGIPGHHHHEDEELHEDELHAEAAEPAGVYARLRQNRFSLAGEWYSPFRGIETLSLNTAYTDYQHQEIEQGAIGTTFNNTSLESRLSAEHVEVNGWHGLVGYHLQHSDYQALGDEAFTPDTDSLSQALFVLEEKQFGSVSAQLGARIEHSRYQVGDILL